MLCYVILPNGTISFAERCIHAVRCVTVRSTVAQLAHRISGDHGSCSRVLLVTFRLCCAICYFDHGNVWCSVVAVCDEKIQRRLISTSQRSSSVTGWRTTGDREQAAKNNVVSQLIDDFATCCGSQAHLSIVYRREGC